MSNNLKLLKFQTLPLDIHQTTKLGHLLLLDVLFSFFFFLLYMFVWYFCFYLIFSLLWDGVKRSFKKLIKNPKLFYITPPPLQDSFLRTYAPTQSNDEDHFSSVNSYY